MNEDHEYNVREHDDETGPGESEDDDAVKSCVLTMCSMQSTCRKLSHAAYKQTPVHKILTFLRCHLRCGKKGPPSSIPPRETSFKVENAPLNHSSTENAHSV